MCQRTGSVPCCWHWHPGSLIKPVASPRLNSRQLNKFGCFGNPWDFGTRDAFSMCMWRLPWLKNKPRTNGPVSGGSLPGDTRVLFEIKAWIPSEIKAISVLVERLMRLIEESRCVWGGEPCVELALAEALNNAVVHGNRMDCHKLVQIFCRCELGKGVSVVVTDQGQGFDPNAVPDPTAAENINNDHGRGIWVMKSMMDEVSFERGGTEVRMRKAPIRQPGVDCEAPTK
jgi:anti-sigma regulatory factor (Ser/Thr protein kinase)